MSRHPQERRVHCADQRIHVDDRTPSRRAPVPGKIEREHGDPTLSEMFDLPRIAAVVLAESVHE